MHPGHLDKQLEELRLRHHLRSLRLPAHGMVDFSSNDYLGLARESRHLPLPQGSWGSTGSRLLAGNAPVHEWLEREAATFFRAESALLFSSGFLANLALLSAIPQRGDTLLMDALCHASLREGARLSHAQHFTFGHNDLADLERLLGKAKGSTYVVTEALFSMDGDSPPLHEMVELCERHGAWLILDEAHSTGIMGSHGEGLAVQLGLEGRVMARVHAFGKAVGRMGAVVVADQAVTDHLVNRARPFIYTTAMPEVMAESVRLALAELPGLQSERLHLVTLRKWLNEALHSIVWKDAPAGEGPIVPLLVPGNEEVRRVAARLQGMGMDVRPILSPTVAAGSERLRVILHSHNTEEEINRLQQGLAECLPIQP